MSGCVFLPLDDADHDGYPASSDCDDQDAAVHPGVLEVCDDLDNDCDGTMDEDASDAATWYIDYDGDGAGSSLYSARACQPPTGYVADADDCNDLEPDVFPSGTETCDGLDNDCDGQVDESVDADQDGYAVCGTEEEPGDCDDGDPETHPDAPELCDGLDNDCDGHIDPEIDADGDDFAVCVAGSPGDCADADPAVHPGALEACNRQDDNCDGRIDEASDADGDGYTACGVTGELADCDDHDGSIHPGAVEGCDGRDQDCDGVSDEGFVDQDGDGSMACVDCDDTDARVSPTAYETCDGFDNNCNGVIDDGGDCPCKVDWYGGHAYMFCTYTSDWEAARQTCLSFQYRLVTINDLNENTWINYTANSLLVTDWWIGLSDSAVEGSFQWSDAAPLSFVHWSSGEPNNLNNEDCVELYPDGNWNDKACSSAWYRYICESG